MKGIVRTVDKLGRVVLPKNFRDALGINIKDEVVITLENHGLKVMKVNRYAKCAMTGEYSDDLKVYGNGIFLSEKGKKLLVEELNDE